MSDTDILMDIVDYLDAFDKDLQDEYFKASDEARVIVSAKMSVVSEIIEYIERRLGIAVRTPDIGSFY